MLGYADSQAYFYVSFFFFFKEKNIEYLPYYTNINLVKFLYLGWIVSFFPMRKNNVPNKE